MSKSYKKREIFICRGTGCNSSNAADIHNELKKLIQNHKLSDYINIKLTGCHGFCQMGPIIKIQPDKVLYVKVEVNDVKDIIEQHLIKNKLVEKLLYKDPKTGELIKNMEVF